MPSFFLFFMNAKRVTKINVENAICRKIKHAVECKKLNLAGKINMLSKDNANLPVGKGLPHPTLWDIKKM